MTGEAVRQQLIQLQREGWVDLRVERERRTQRSGRPAALFRLTAKGDHLFPKHYDTLTIALMDAIAQLGDDSLHRVLSSLTDAKLRIWEPKLRGLDLQKQVEALRNMYLDGDQFTEVMVAEDGVRLIERNCPYLNTAMARPAICDVSMNLLRRALGVNVVREERFQDGHGRCVFRVKPDEPSTGEWVNEK